MSKFNFWLNIILTLIVLALIGWNLADFNQSKAPAMIENSQPNYQTANAVTHVYDPMGKLAYKLITDETHHFSSSKISWFINPVLTTYDTKSIPTWAIRANKAKLTSDNMLYLYGNVQVNSLNPTSDLQQILTENAIVNLITQDVSSNNKVTLIGIGLRSVGMEMRGNMRTHTAELIEDVKTYYEIPNKQPAPEGNH
ncbi:LPS export ABC transporter periplasmic protein LptC [Arsenophonus nasoniae]|nr:LPS export ABC transporter periplasmic protein LptC [Arsenophonus nasoniae]WGM07836.1 LPS export ABC transporter periplasmic protein LptC [Arsenophonus nasoniae]WGM12718.1 LPS export ABC transporter periplasmic protein LptC [Arsenophonus nasoniae]WGM17371.1 LPS export ABC transporter periplasmic protein LptC [Arsenophonus nasoniae]CBA75345.1 lipopolysaccharide export system protein LptC [Arsenophonus nasoniae]